MAKVTIVVEDKDISTGEFDAKLSFEPQTPSNFEEYTAAQKAGAMLMEAINGMFQVKRTHMFRKDEQTGEMQTTYDHTHEPEDNKRFAMQADKSVN